MSKPSSRRSSGSHSSTATLRSSKSKLSTDVTSSTLHKEEKSQMKKSLVSTKEVKSPIYRKKSTPKREKENNEVNDEIKSKKQQLPIIENNEKKTDDALNTALELGDLTKSAFDTTLNLGVVNQRALEIVASDNLRYGNEKMEPRLRIKNAPKIELTPPLTKNDRAIPLAPPVKNIDVKTAPQNEVQDKMVTPTSSTINENIIEAGNGFDFENGFFDNVGSSVSESKLEENKNKEILNLSGTQFNMAHLMSTNRVFDDKLPTPKKPTLNDSMTDSNTSNNSKVAISYAQPKTKKLKLKRSKDSISSLSSSLSNSIKEKTGTVSRKVVFQPTVETMRNINKESDKKRTTGVQSTVVLPTAQIDNINVINKKELLNNQKNHVKTISFATEEKQDEEELKETLRLKKSSKITKDKENYDKNEEQSTLVLTKSVAEKNENKLPFDSSLSLSNSGSISGSVQSHAAMLRRSMRESEVLCSTVIEDMKPTKLSKSQVHNFSISLDSSKSGTNSTTSSSVYTNKEGMAPIKLDPVLTIRANTQESKQRIQKTDEKTEQISAQILSENSRLKLKDDEDDEDRKHEIKKKHPNKYLEKIQKTLIIVVIICISLCIYTLLCLLFNILFYKKIFYGVPGLESIMAKKIIKNFVKFQKQLPIQSKTHSIYRQFVDNELACPQHAFCTLSSDDDEFELITDPITGTQKYGSNVIAKVACDNHYKLKIKKDAGYPSNFVFKSEYFFSIIGNRAFQLYWNKDLEPLPELITSMPKMYIKYECRLDKTKYNKARKFMESELNKVRKQTGSLLKNSYISPVAAANFATKRENEKYNKFKISERLLVESTSNELINIPSDFRDLLNKALIDSDISKEILPEGLKLLKTTDGRFFVSSTLDPIYPWDIVHSHLIHNVEIIVFNIILIVVGWKGYNQYRINKLYKTAYQIIRDTKMNYVIGKAISIDGILYQKINKKSLVDSDTFYILESQLKDLAYSKSELDQFDYFGGSIVQSIFLSPKRYNQLWDNATVLLEKEKKLRITMESLSSINKGSIVDFKDDDKLSRNFKMKEKCWSWKGLFNKNDWTKKLAMFDIIPSPEQIELLMIVDKNIDATCSSSIYTPPQNNRFFTRFKKSVPQNILPLSPHLGSSPSVNLSIASDPSLE